MFQEVVKIGTFGGHGGSPFEFYVDKRYGIQKIVIRTGDYVDSLTITLADRMTRRAPITRKIGGDGGSYTKEFTIDLANGEYLKTVTGTVSHNNYIQSLTFVTNKTKHGPYGHTSGTYFSYPIEHGEIYGVYGRSGLYIDSIGLCVAPPFTYHSC